jgi:hypothetical protein
MTNSLTPPTHVTSWTTDIDDVANHDHSRVRGCAQPEHIVEVDLGNGLTQTTYVDCAHRPHLFNVGD